MLGFGFFALSEILQGPYLAEAFVVKILLGGVKANLPSYANMYHVQKYRNKASGPGCLFIYDYTQV